MTKIIAITSLIFFISCSSPEPSLEIYFDRESGNLIVSDSTKFDSVLVSNMITNRSFSISVKDRGLSVINVYQYMAYEWNIGKLEQIDTLSYNIYLELSTQDRFGYNLIFGYINDKNKWQKKLDTIRELKR